MAWKWRLTAVTDTVDGVDDDGNPVTIPLWQEGRFRATFEILNDANQVVETTSAEFPHDIDRAAAITRISAQVARKRDAKARVTALAGDVGKTVTVP